MREKAKRHAYEKDEYCIISEECSILAKNMRKKMLNIAEYIDEDIHWGGAFSSVEILAVLYHGILNIKQQTVFEKKDKFLLSKGHAAIAVYTAMNLEGLLSDELYSTYRDNGSSLSELMHYDKELGFEISGGSLGLGISYGVGLALLAKKKGFEYHTYVEVGDGELDEGNMWEAIMAASQFALDNLTVIVDSNMLQSDGSTEKIMNLGSLADKFQSFGFEVCEVDGHSCQALVEAFHTKNQKNLPKVIIAHTVKGKGVSFMESNPLWHDRRLKGDELKQAKEEIK